VLVTHGALLSFWAKNASSRGRYKKQNGDGTQMKTKEATKNEANELKY